MSFFKKLKLFSVASGVLFSLFCYGATVVDDDMDWLVPIIKAAVDKAKENAGGGGAGGGTSPVAQPWDLSVRPEPAPLPSGSATGFFVPATSQVSDILVAPINKGNTPGTITGSFYVDATGRANYSVPVKLPPGIRGLTPSLSISYSGSSANGLLGVGWSISGISSITRCAKTISQDGKIGIVSLSPDDALCMDGSRLLGVGTNEYKTEIESFKKIVSTSTMAGYPDSFTVTTKDGVVYKYGLDANSRLTASGASGKVLTWMVSSISDVDGNAIKFSYLKNAGNFPASTSTGALATEVVPDKIEYGGGTQPLTTVQFKYASGRADWDVNTVAGSRFWTTKLLDKIEVNNNASLVRQYELVYTKSGKGKDATEAGFNPSLLANIKECGIDANSNKLCTDATRFDWTEPAKASVAMGTSLEADQPVWRSLSNPSLTSDTASDVFYYAKDVAYSAQLDANGSIYYLHGLVSGYGGYVGTHSYYVNSSPISRFYPCVPSSGTATDAAFRPSSQISGFPRGVNDPVTLKNYLSLQDNGALYGCQKWGGSNDQPMLFYTANKAISSFTASSHAVVALNGSSFEYQLRNAQNVWTAAASISAPNSNIVQFSLVDSAYNGGATYLLAVDSNGNAWKRFLARSDNTGNCITSWCQIGPSGEKIRQLHPFYAQPGDTALYSYFGLMLLTQSGDLLLDKTDPIDVMTATKPSTGYEKLASNVSKVKISSEWVKDVSNGLSCSNLKIGVISNGGLFYLTDGKATISCGSTKPLLEQAKWRAEAGDVRDFDIDTGYITVIDSTGNLFIRTNIADGGTYKLIGKNVRSASIVNNSTGDKAATTRAIVVAGEVPEPFRLARIVDGLGKETSITYGTTNDSAVYTDNLPVFYPNSRLNGRMTVVKSVKQSDGLGGQVSDFYSYFNARVDQNGRGFLGFSQSKHTDPLGIETSSHYLQSFPYIGLNHYRTDIKGGITLRATSTDFRSVSQSADNKRYFVYPKTVQIATYDQDNNGALLSGEENSVNAIDAYGNVTEQKRTYTQYAVKDGAENNKVFESLTKTTYSNDSSAWLLGLPTSRIERRTNPDATVKYVANEYVYDTTKKHRVATLKQNGKVGDSWAITYDDSSKLFTSFVYDSVGNVSQQSVTGMAGKDANGVAVNQTRVTKTTWGNNGVYPTEVFHPVDMAKGRVSGEKREFDTRFGLMSKLTDRNGAATVTSYDTLGRPVSMTFPDGRSKTISYAACNSTLTPPANCAYQVTEQETARPTRVTFYDILARPLASEQSAFGAKTVRTHRVYDSLGRVSAESRPYFKTDTLKPVTSFYYDTYGRLGSVAKPDGGAISYAYGGLAETESKTTKSGGAEVTTIRYRDVLGRINRVDQALASNTWLTQRYSYDPLGVLKTSTDPNGNQIALVIDDWGRKTKQTDPDLGVWQYSYNAFGEMLTQIDAKTKTTSFEYDALGRLTKRTEPTLTSNWVYDTAANGIDKLASVTADNGTSRSLAYDAPGRVTQISTKLASSVNLKRAYDSSSGLLISEEYPNAFKLRYEYDSIGNLQRVRQWNDTAANGALYWEATAYAPTGKVSSFKLGNGITTTRAISASTGLFDSINSTNAAAKAIQAFGYKYDYVGNLLERTDTSWQSELATPAALNFKETFAYDRLNRLDTAQVAGGLLRDYDYDSLGNLTKKTDFSNKLVYGNTRPHAVSKVYSPGFESDPNKAWSYSYDANGNVSDELYGVLATRHIDYDSANYVTAVTRYKADGATVQAQQGFLYDADRMRVKETLSSNGSNKTTYVLRPETHAGGHYECDYAASACTEQRVYLQANGELFAMATQIGSNAATLQYFHTDHLGSVALVTDAAGAVAERMAFDPFGARRLLNGGADFTLKGQKTRRGYTGHDQLDELGLVHMNGRIYHPAIGRFVSPDPNVFHPDDSQDFNRYAYVHNNPLAATDPSGFAMFGLDDGALDGVFQPGLNFSFNFPSQNWSLTSEERKIERYFQNACPTSNCGGGSGPVSQQATGSSSVDAAKSQKQSNASVTAENNLGGLQQLMRWRSSESTVAPGRKMGEIEDAQTASRSFALGFVPGPGVVEGIEEFQNGKYLLGIGMIASELPGLKQLKAAKGAANVEQYALRAGESGFYPVMTRGSKEATDLKWLEKGDVWKFGTTKNPSTRYSQSYLDNIGEYGVYYSTEFKGTLQEALKLESMKIRNYIFQTGELPAGNKMIK